MARDPFHPVVDGQKGVEDVLPIGGPRTHPEIQTIISIPQEAPVASGIGAEVAAHP